MRDVTQGCGHGLGTRFKGVCSGGGFGFGTGITFGFGFGTEIGMISDPGYVNRVENGIGCGCGF